MIWGFGRWRARGRGQGRRRGRGCREIVFGGYGIEVGETIGDGNDDGVMMG